MISLLGSYLLRLSPPLAYNFVAICRSQSSKFQVLIFSFCDPPSNASHPPQFPKEMLGDMEVIPFLGTSFTSYFPLVSPLLNYLFMKHISTIPELQVILLFCAGTFFNLYGRLLKLLGATHSSFGRVLEPAPSSTPKPTQVLSFITLRFFHQTI